MFKIVSAEIKKIVSKPGIYILSVLLALILVLGVFIYKPKVHETQTVELNGVSFVEKHTDFINDEKTVAESNLQNAIKSINNYHVTVSGETYNKKDHIDSLVEKFNDYYNEYYDCAVNSKTPQYHVDNVRSNFVVSLENLNTVIKTSLLQSQEGSYSIISTKDNYNLYVDTYEKVLKWAKVSVKQENLKDHLLDFESLYRDDFYSSINNLKYPTLSESFIKNYTSIEEGTSFYVLNKRLDEISKEIAENYNLALNDSDLNITSASKMDELANLYTNTVNTYVNLVKYELITNAFSIVSTKDQLKMLYLSDYSNYDSKSLLERYNYLFENNEDETNYARPLSIGLTSNDSINAYDYSYFVLKIFAFVIIVYAIMSACHTIAGEIREGSMRYLSIRPISRTNMFFGKWLSIIIMCVVLMLFSTIISLCVGGAVYGFDSSTILTIFNGTTAIILHPIAMIGIYLLSMLLELVLYSLIAMLLSTLFKSDLMSMTILLVVFLLNLLLPVFIQGANTWLAFYPFSHISLYSLFGSSVYAVSGNFLNLVFGEKIYAGTHIALTLSIILIMSVVVSALALKVFKRKEL